jgi:hypothetical protein
MENNFDLKKFLVENKLTPSAQKLNEGIDLKKVAELMKARKYNELSKMPGDKEVVKKILPLLKNTQIGKDFKAWAEQNKDSVLSEGAVKNTLLGLLAAAVLGLGISSGVDSSMRSQAADKAVATTTQSQSSDYQKGYEMLDFYKNNKEKIQDLAKDNIEAKLFADQMENLMKAPNKNDLMQSIGGSTSSQKDFQAIKSQVNSMSTAQFNENKKGNAFTGY